LPPNPIHFSAIALSHFKRARYFDMMALLFSSTFVDLELLYSWLLGKPMYHGLWHSYLFVLTIYPFVLSIIIYAMERRFEKTISRVYAFFKFFPRKVAYSFNVIFLSCAFGGLSHIFLDMWVHENSNYVLFPFYKGNPFWIGEYSFIIFALVGLLSLYSFILWFRQIE